MTRFITIVLLILIIIIIIITNITRISANCLLDGTTSSSTAFCVAVSVLVPCVSEFFFF